MKSPFRLIHFGLCAALLAGFCAAPDIQAASTPLSEKIPEAQETLVRCTLAKASKKPLKIGRANIEFQDGEYSYTLWIPSGYNADPKRRWPCVFIGDPGGHAKMGIMGNHLKNSGFIVVMLQESKNGPDAPCNANFVSAHDDVVARLRVAEGLKYATGMSGASRSASLNAQLRPGFAGLFQQAAGFLDNIAANLPRGNFCVVTSIGSKDYNFVEYPSIATLTRGHSWFPIIAELGHGWSSEPIAEKAFLLMEAHTMSNAPVTPDLRAAAKTWFARHAESIRKMPALLDKIQFAERTLKAAAKLGLQNDSALAPLKTDLMLWKKEPAAAKEIAADAAFVKELAKDISTIPRHGGKPPKGTGEIIKRFPGTEAAARAKLFSDAYQSPASQ